ncbi:MAG: response regulator [Geobacteraceae bacterium]|nr:response regulator [Geobacteraceae bacterium]NTW80767.1 response regulator [Geobacteraceae bacterium]
MKRFLIVDDDNLSCKILAEFMSEFAVCDTAANGRIGYELFEKAIADGHPYDLICSDVFMPDFDGHEMVRDIRAREESLPIAGYIRTKIFMISSSGSSKDISQAILDNSCDDYIVKPFRSETLKAMLTKYNLI